MLRYGRMLSEKYVAMLLINLIFRGKNMRKLLILLLFISTVPLFAQKINYGLKAGITSSDQTWEYTYRFAKSGYTEVRKGMNFGIFAEYSEDKYLGVIAEVNYRQKGANIFLEYTGRDTSGLNVVPKHIEHKLSYLNVSLLGKVKYALPYVTPYVCAGLKTDFQLSNKFDDEDLGFVADESTTQIWGVVIGGGFEVRDLLPVVVLGEFRYEFDFNKIYSSDQFQFKTNTIEFRLGVKF